MRLIYNDQVKKGTVTADALQAGYGITRIQDNARKTKLKFADATYNKKIQLEIAQEDAIDRKKIEAEFATTGLPALFDGIGGSAPLYSQDAFATTDSWSGTNCTLTAPGGGILRAVSTINGSYFYATRAISIPVGYYHMRIRARVTAGQLRYRYRLFLNNTSSRFSRYINFRELNEWQTFDVILDNTAGVGSLIGFYHDALDTVIGETIEFDWIVFGIGAYNSSLTDLSGNARHATPCVGVFPTTLDDLPTELYLQDKWNTVDDWIGNTGTVLIAEAGTLLVKGTTSDPYISKYFSFPGSVYQKIILRMRTFATSTETMTIYYATGGHGYIGSYRKDAPRPWPRPHP